MEPISCPSHLSLQAFHLGTLPEPELDWVADHLEICAACDAAMRRLDDAPDDVLAALQRPLANQADLGETQAFDGTERHEEIRAARSVSGSQSPESGVSDYLRLVFEEAGYEIGEQLGRGGMGVVYRARESALHRDVALKVLLPGSALSPAAVTRFRAEAEAVASLQHPNIVQIHAIGAHDDFSYLSLEYVRGGNLAEMLGGQPLAAKKAAALIETLARAIAAAHRQGIVHRDLKPANVLLTPDGSPKITDFGIAKQMDKDQRQTESGVVVGTPGYMAPEQVLARRDQIRPETDIYALGAILYEMLSGRPPFLGVSVHETLELVCNQEPVPPSRLQPSVPRDLETICLKCLRKEPGRRYCNADELASDVRLFLRGEPIRARPIRAWERGLRWARRNPILSAVMALCAGLLLTIAIGSSVGVVLLRTERSKVVEEQAQRRRNVVESVLEVSPAGLPVLLNEMKENREVFVRLVAARRMDETLKPNEKLRLSMAMAALGDPSVDDLIRVVATAPAGECANLVASFRAAPADGLPALRAAFSREKGVARLRLAVILLELGDSEAALEFLAYRPVPEQRTGFIHQFANWHGNLAGIPRLLKTHDDGALRSGLCAALGRLNPELLGPAVRAELRDAFAHLHRHAIDGNTHSTAAWALRRWGEIPPAGEPRDSSPLDQDWFVTRHGMTMIRAEPPGKKDDKKNAWPLWVSDREVSAGLFRRFMNDASLAEHEKNKNWPGVNPAICPSDDCPVHNVNFLDMIHFCNWLSRKEKRTPCYRPVPEKPGFWKCVVSANGYRLPSRAEWMFACRAGVATMFHFGEDATLLPEYANVLLPRTEPGGLRLPNDWGIFDTLANEWDISFEPPPRHDPFDPSTAAMTLCGGTYGTGSFYSRCESSGSTVGSNRHDSRGFRVFLRESLPDEADSQWVEMEMADRLVEQISQRIDKGAMPLERFSGFERLKRADPGFVAAAAGAESFKGLLQRSSRAAMLQRLWDKASRYHAAHLELFPRDNFRECQWAMLFAEDPAYPEIRRQLIERWGASAQWSEISRVVKACSLGPAAKDRAELLLEMALRATRQLEATETKNKEFHFGYCAWVEALALYRVERFEEVLPRSDAAQSAPGMPLRMKVSNHLVRALALQGLGRTKEARAAYDQALAIPLPKEGTGGYADAWNDHHVVKVLLREAAARLGRPVIRFDDLGMKPLAMTRDTLSKRVTGYLRQGDWAKAKNVLLEWVAAFPDDHAEACKLAPLLLIAGDEAGYRDLRTRMLDRYKETKSWQVAERTAKVCSLLPPEKSQTALILDLGRRGSELVRLTTDNPYFTGSCALAHGLASYRASHFDKAIAQLDAALATNGLPASMRLTAHALRAMALHRMDRRVEARLALNDALAIPLTKEDAPSFLISWNDHLIARLLRWEAEALIRPGKK